MEKILLGDLWFEPYISRDDIDRATSRVASQIASDYAGRARMPVLLVTMNGAMIWASQLVQHLGRDTEWAFTKCASYGDGIVTSGEVQISVEPCVELAGRDILVIEDVIDSGNTWCALHKYLTAKGAASIRIATMSLKPDAYHGQLPVDYVALEVKNDFIIGNGLDYDQRGRHLRDLYIICK